MLSSKLTMPQIETSEVASLVASLSWCVPLLVHPSILSTSVYLMAIEKRISHDVLLALTASLLLLHLCALLLCCYKREPKRCRALLRVRRELLRLSCAVWLFIAYLVTTTGYIMPGSILFLSIGLSCGVGIRALDVQIVALRETEAVEALRAMSGSIPIAYPNGKQGVNIGQVSKERA